MAVIQKTKSGSWKAIVRKARFGVRLKVKTFTLKTDAVAWARKIESEIEQGIWRPSGGADHMTLGEALDKYIIFAKQEHRGATAELAHIAVMRSEPLMRVTLDKITPENILALSDRWSTSLAVATVNRRLTILQSVFTRARKVWGMKSLENPIEGLKLKGATSRDRRVSDAEIAALVAASDSPFLAVAVRLAVETAMRRGELCRLTWSMVDLNACVANLPRTITKNGRPRNVPLSSAAVDVLESLPHERTLVLGCSRPATISQALSRAAKRGQARYLAQCTENGTEPVPGFLKDLHFHDLRHEATTRLALLFGLHELMKIVGHNSSAMLDHYYHPDAADFAVRMRQAPTWSR